MRGDRGSGEGRGGGVKRWSEWGKRDGKWLKEGGCDDRMRE